MIENKTQSLYKILPEMRRRWSPKSFTEKAVEISKLQSAFEAARWAPSSYNEQPWRFLLGIKNTGATYDLLFDAILEKNKIWAHSAPVLVLVCCRENFSHKDLPNRCALYDTGAAVGQMVLQLCSNGLHARQIAGLNVDLARMHFKVPEEYKVICIVAIGYLPDQDDWVVTGPPPRSRKDFDEFVFAEEWNNKSNLF